MRDDGLRTAVNQRPHGGSDYPFVVDSAYSQLLTDFYLSYQDDVCEFVEPFKLDWLYGFGDVPAAPPLGSTPANARDVRVVDALDNVVFDSSLAVDYRETAWGDRIVSEWHSDTSVLRLVARTTAAPDFQTNETPDLALDVRTCERLPFRVTSLRVGAFRFTGKVRFEQGYNMAIVAGAVTPVDGGRRRSPIDMDAVPGEGLGQAPGCEETVATLRRINRILPSVGGNFVIEADECFRIQRPLSVVTEEFIPGYRPHYGSYAATGYTTTQAQASLQLQSDCQPCCPCDYFVRTYRGLKRMWDLWKETASDAEGVRDLYALNRQRWLDQLTCRQENPARLLVIGDRNCKVFVGGSVCNFSQCCLSPIELRFTVKKFSGNTLVPLSSLTVVDADINASSTRTTEKYAPEIIGPVIRFVADYSNAQATTVARMRICSACEVGESLQVTLTVHAPDPEPNGNGVICELPTPEVDADILAIWAANGVPATPTVRAVLTEAAPLNPDAPSFDCGC